MAVSLRAWHPQTVPLAAPRLALLAEWAADVVERAEAARTQLPRAAVAPQGAVQPPALAWLEPEKQPPWRAGAQAARHTRSLSPESAGSTAPPPLRRKSAGP